jgi:branched-chain amino acid transport system permease protein
MNKQSLQKSAGSGVVFGIIVIFLALIGFTVVFSGLIQKVLGQSLGVGQIPSIGNFFIFLAFLGIWNGWRASRQDKHETLTLAKVLLRATVAGLAAGVLVMLYGFVVGGMDARGIDMRSYLSMLSSDSIKFFLFNQNLVLGGLIHLAFSTLMAMVGGLLALGSEKSQQQVVATRLRIQKWSQSTWLGKVQGNPYVSYVLMGVVLLLLVLLPRTWGAYWNYVMGTVGIYVLLGLGLNIIVGLSGQLVLGYVAFFAIGAYTFALTTSPEPHNLVWNFWVALAVSVVAAALSGILIGLPILRLRGDYLAIVTLGFGEIIRILLKSDILKDFTMGPRGVRNIAGPTLFGRSFTSDVDFMYVIILAVLLSIFLAKRWQESSIGRAWLAISQDETVAQATGVDTYKYKLLALSLGAAFAGLGGALFASRNQFTGPEDHALMVSINVLCLVIVGGMGSLPGIVLGAFTLKGLPEILRELESYRLLVFGALLVVMMIIRPEGLWPARRPKLEVPIEQEKEPAQVPAPVGGKK